MVGNHSQSVKVEGSLTARLTSRAGTKVGLSDPVVPYGRAIAQRIKATLGITGLSPPRVHIDGEVWHSVWKGHRSTDKSYPGDNRLISPKSPHRRGGLAPRCRLIASWGCSRSQWLGCSPIKSVRELGSERRETVRSLSVAGVGNLRGPVISTRGPVWTYLWCTSCSARSTAG